MNDVTSTIVSQPGTRNVPANFETSDAIPKRNESPETAKPRSSARRRGRVEKLMRPSVARRIILRSVYFELPAKRVGTAYGTAICRKPSQANMPRTKRFRSGIARNASTTRRSIIRKSPAAAGISMLASLCSTR